MLVPWAHDDFWTHRPHQLIAFNMHVGIIGGGISGLYSGLLLLREGHTITIFEATHKLGGRTYTHHFNPRSADEDPYFEAGAMRVPKTHLHRLVFELAAYLNSRTPRANQIKFIPYFLEHGNNQAFVQGKIRDLVDRNEWVDWNLPAEYCGKAPNELLLHVTQPWINRLKLNFDEGFQELLIYDNMSFRSYLQTVIEWPDQVIEFVETLCSQTNQYDLSFPEIIMQNLDFGTKGLMENHFLDSNLCQLTFEFLRLGYH